MPYITREQREKYDTAVKVIVRTLRGARMDKRDGELNYVITKILKESYLRKYFHLNRAIGVLECVKQEFYRVVAGPYEEIKRKEQGDV